MTPNLPAYREALEADALAYTRARIAEHCGPDGGVFHPSAVDVYGKAMMKRWAESANAG